MDAFKLINLNNHVCFALYTTSHAFTRVYSERLSEVGLTYEQYLVMLVLWQQQQQTIQAIAEKLNLDLTTLMPVLKVIEDAGLIECSLSNQNNQETIVSLTTLGNQIQFKTSQIQQKMACETGLTDLEHIDLREKLDKMLDNFKIRLQYSDT